jgi:hypothetical protein
MYIPAILVGIVVDSQGPRLGVGLGAVLLGIGYFAIYIGSSICYSWHPDVNDVSFQIRTRLFRRSGSVLFFLLDRLRQLLGVPCSPQDR